MAQAFSILNTSKTVTNRHTDAIERHCERLSLFSEVPAHALRAQLDMLKPVAVAEAQSRACDDREAWCKVVRMHGACDALHAVVRDWQVFTVSTSGIEQTFTQGMQAVSDKQEHCDEETEWAYWKVKVDAARDSLDTLVPIARKLYLRRFGICRDSTWRAPRKDTGLQKPERRCKDSEAAFIDARRNFGPSATSEVMDLQIDDMVDALEVDNWHDKHARELDFAEKKRRAKLVQAAADGLLTTSENANDDEMTAAVHSRLQAQQVYDFHVCSSVGGVDCKLGSEQAGRGAPPPAGGQAASMGLVRVWVREGPRRDLWWRAWGRRTPLDGPSAH